MNCSPAPVLNPTATVRVCIALLVCLGLVACATTKKISNYDSPVSSVTVVYATARDMNSSAGPYRTQGDNDRFLETKKFSEFTNLFHQAIVDEFARENVAASFEVVETLPESMSGFKTPHVLSLRIKEVRLTFLDVSGYIVYEATLDDVGLGQMVWQRDESTGAGAFSTLDQDKARSLASHIVSQLKSEKLLAGRS
jgi:hypothetical protein